MGLLKSFIHLKGGGNFEEVLYINMTSSISLNFICFL